MWPSTAVAATASIDSSLFQIGASPGDQNAPTVANNKHAAATCRVIERPGTHSDSITTAT